MSIFMGWWGMNWRAGQTNCVNRKAVLGQFVCSVLRFIPHEPRIKHSFLTMFPSKILYMKFSEKSYTFKFLLFMAPTTLFDVNHCTVDFPNWWATNSWLCLSEIVHFQVPGTQPFKTLILHARLRTSRTLPLFFIMTSYAFSSAS